MKLKAARGWKLESLYLLDGLIYITSSIRLLNLTAYTSGLNTAGLEKHKQDVVEKGFGLLLIKHKLRQRMCFVLLQEQGTTSNFKFHRARRPPGFQQVF